MTQLCLGRDSFCCDRKPGIWLMQRENLLAHITMNFRLLFDFRYGWNLGANNAFGTDFLFVSWQ